jgi:hypothetical protein
MELDPNRDGRQPSMVDRLSSGLSKYSTSQDRSGHAEGGPGRNSMAQGMQPEADGRDANTPQPRYGVRQDLPPGATTTNYPFLSRPSHQASYDNRADEKASERGSDLSQPRPSSIQPTNVLETFRRMRDSRSVGPGQHHHGQAPGQSNAMDHQAPPGHRSPSLTRTGHPGSSALARTDSNMSNQEDGLHPGKSLLGHLMENKRGRLSPLPQAVQGAQARMRGPASEPGIKNEFARMFSGIGSGVGSAASTPVPMETNAPHSFPASPTMTEDRGHRIERVDLSEHVKLRTASRGGRRGRKPKEEDLKVEGESRDGPGLTRSSSGRGVKRNRHSYQAHSTTHAPQYVPTCSGADLES